MKAETSESQSDRDTILPVVGISTTADEVRPEGLVDASSGTGADSAEIDPLAPAQSSGSTGAEVDLSTADTLVVGIPTLTTGPLAREIERRRAIISRISAAIPNIGLDDRAGRVILSILLAFLLWFYVVSLENPSQTTVFNDLNVEVRGLTPGLKLVNPVSPVDVTVQAPQNVLGFLRPADVRPYVDLTGISSGVRTIPVQADVRNTQGGGLDVSINPANTQIQLEVEVSRDIQVQVQIAGTPAYGYGYDAPQATPGNVRVTGAEDAVARIAKLVTRVNIDDRAATVQGTREPVALDDAGNEIPGLTFEPARVQVVVPIRLGVLYKVVGVRADTRGQPAPGYRVAAITTEPNTITICCSPTVLSDTQFLNTMPISISGTTFNVITQTQLVLPTDVELYPGQTKTISVTVSVEALVTTLELSVAPIPEGQPEGMTVVASPDRLDLTLTGTFDQLQDLKPTDVRAFLSLEGRGPGTYDIRPQIVVPQGVKLEKSTPDTVSVTIIAPTPVPTHTATPAPTRTPAPTATPHATPTAGEIATPTVAPQAETATKGVVTATLAPSAPTAPSQPTP